MTTHLVVKLTAIETGAILTALDLYIEEVEDGTGRRATDARRAVRKIETALESMTRAPRLTPSH